MSLFNDIRPSSFSDIIGNREIVESLKALLSKKNPPHAFLFHGQTGTGKTTLARILASEFGSSDTDLEELNGADNRGIDDARRIINIASVQPLVSNARVFIIDECHKMTNDAQNSLLKIVEEPPSSSYFIFCSTEPEKIIKTIRNRCAVFQTSLLKEDEMELLLTRGLVFLEKELDDDSFFRIIDAAEGCPRLALSILEQIIYAPLESRATLIQKVRAERETIELCRALMHGNSWKEISEIYKNLKDVEIEQIRRAILGYLKTVLLSNHNPEMVSNMIGIFEENLFDGGEAKLVRMLYDCCNKGR